MSDNAVVGVCCCDRLVCVSLCVFNTKPIETAEPNYTSHLGLMSQSGPIIDQRSTGLELFTDWLGAAQVLLVCVCAGVFV